MPRPKYFLSQFCTLFYRRNRYTIRTISRSRFNFLDGKLANGILAEYRKTDIVRKFLTEHAAPESILM